jgi:hypothetical protein
MERWASLLFAISVTENMANPGREILRERTERTVPRFARKYRRRL